MYEVFIMHKPVFNAFIILFQNREVSVFSHFTDDKIELERGYL